MPSRDELHARLFLLRAAEPPAPAIHQYVAVHGPVDAVARIRHGTAPAAVLSEITRPEAEIDNDLRALDGGTARLLTPEDDDWPFGRLTSLAASHGVPLALWVRGSGSLAELTTPAVTVTGSRASSAYGNTVAADLGYELARAGVTVVSGGGLGVDEEAHRSTLAADGRTIVVLANGVDRTHPHQHARLYQTVIEQGGLLVSEYPIGTPPARIRFHARCRLLAALAAATVIVEAGQRSGALAVARAAGELGRRVYGVPGSIHSVTSKGVNELLRTGAATVASSVEHINYQEGVR
ncbi:DNA-processing protein DprA [Lentzea aerocolonigenes]|uniref:DNA-processing protein DprA n=1 Tax=Lentzea aerocolonigenes TaxID=68170 RepID=UPI00068A82C5|nr:DNA-processing protein DprA [Lentzea aerocolonigenes]MCP2249458.1 DNA processing protein [Lentzea aerocolonigenes]